MDSSDICLNRLPKHFFEVGILAKLSLRDLIRFGALCHSLRSIAADIQDYYHQLPWLMISQDKDTQTGTFFSLSDSKIYHLKLEYVPSQSYCCGSTQGYLIMANRKENFLYNPFSHTQISLPQQYIPRQDYCPMKECYDYFTKAVISSPPTAGSISQCVVAALCSNTHVIEMCRPHDAEWSICSADKNVDQKIIYTSDPDELENDDLDDDDDDDDDDGGDLEEEDEEEEEGKEIVVMDELARDDKFLFSDILFLQAQCTLYGLTYRNELVCFESQDLKPTYRILNVLPMEKPMDAKVTYINNYLVESCGELFMVYRFRNCRNWKHTTTKFLVYKLDESTDVPQWVEVKSIDDRMIFLGRNSSMSISAKGVPGVKGNCIYFAEDSRSYFWGEPRSPPCGSDNGIFYLEDRHIEPIICPNDTLTFNIQPLWITPYRINPELLGLL